MKAFVYTNYGPPEVLKLTEMDKPVPKDNEVQIKIKATTVTTVDCIFRRGKQFFARLATGPSKPKSTILGSEFSGVIEAVGKGVKLFKEGNEVFGDTAKGTYTEYICLSEDGAISLKPSSLSFEETAALPYGVLTALPFLRDSGKIKSGQKVLINGASGSIGSFAVQLAKYYGAEVAAVCGPSNVELVNSLGADKVIDYSKEDFTKNREAYDIIFDTVGKSSFSLSKNSLKPGGIYLTTVISAKILFQMLVSAKLGSKKAAIAFTGLRPPADKAKDLVFLKGLAEEGKIKPVIDKRYSFEQIPEAHSYVEKGHKKGNVVITI